MAKAAKTQDIQRFAGLLGIRKKPTPYIGPPDSGGLFTCWREPADNCVDIALRGLNKVVHMIEDSQPGVYWVIDEGPGIPVDVATFENEHGKKEKLSKLYVATGLTHGGSNFDSDQISRGTHGLGIKASNAMAKAFDVWTFRNKRWHHIGYKDARLHSDVKVVKGPPKLPHGIKPKLGTIVRFEPDLKLFHKGSKMPVKEALEWCRLTSYLVKGMTVKITRGDGKTKTFKSAGPQEYLQDEIERAEATITGKPFILSTPVADVAVGFTDAEGDSLVNAYTNGLFNRDGGVHRDALTKSLYDSLVAFSGIKEKAQAKAKAAKARAKASGRKTRKPVRAGAPSFRPKDVCDGLMGMVNYKIAAPQFSSQTKDKLTDDRVTPVAYPEFLAAWTDFWSNHKTMAKQIIDRATLLRSKTESFLKDKKMVKNINAARKGLTTKLAGIVGRCPIEDRELILVEGDSAGGGVKTKRDKSFQAVYPLRGKPLNVLAAKQDKINNNAEVAGLLAAIGIDVTGNRKPTDIPYGRIILMTDADVDGSHIDTLLLAIFYKYTPDLVKAGRVYSVISPLFKATHKGRVVFGMTQDEITEKVGGAKVDMTYLKGWGEINPSELGVAIRPDERKLIKLTWEDAAHAAHMQQLLGTNPSYRKKLFGVE